MTLILVPVQLIRWDCVLAACRQMLQPRPPTAPTMASCIR